MIYNAKNNEYVGYGGEYGVSMHVFTSKSPTGPFVYKVSLPAVFNGLSNTSASMGVMSRICTENVGCLKKNLR